MAKQKIVKPVPKVLKSAPFKLRAVQPYETVIVEKIHNKLILQYKSYLAVQEESKQILFKLMDKLYNSAIQNDLVPQKAEAMLNMIRVALVNEKTFPKGIDVLVSSYMSIERRVRIAELQFWADVNEAYDLWLKPYISLREGYCIVQTPRQYLEQKTNEPSP